MLKKIKPGREAVLVIILMLAFIIIAGYNLYEKYKVEAPGLKVPTCSESAGGDGFLAFYRLLDTYGFNPGRWKRSSFNLPPTPFVFIVGNPQYPPYNKEEAGALLDWVSKGNTLFLIGNPGKNLCEQIGIKIGDPKKSGHPGMKSPRRSYWRHP